MHTPQTPTYAQTHMETHTHTHTHFVLFWAFPTNANMFKLVTESSVLKWNQLKVFKPIGEENI